MRSASLALACAVLCCALLGMSVTVAQYWGMERREAARKFAQVADPLLGLPEGTKPAFLARETTRVLRDGSTATLVVFELVDPDAPTPPGVVAWPEAGEAVASPAWIEANEDTRSGLKAAVGQVPVGAIIDRTGLSDDDEIIAFQRIDQGDLLTGTPYEAVGFGGRAARMSGELYRQPITWLFWAEGVALVLPALILLTVASKVGAGSSARREAILTLVGGSRRAVARVRRWGSAGGILAGASLGLLMLAVVLTQDLRVPSAGYTVRAADNRATWYLHAGACVLAVVVAWGVATSPQRTRTDARGSRRWRTLRLGVPGGMRRLAAPFAAIVTVITCNLVAASDRPSDIMPAFAVGAGVTLLLLPWSVGGWVELFAARAAEPGLFSGRFSLRVAAAQVRARPRPTTRVAVGAAVAVALLCVGARYVDLWRDEALDALGPAALADGRVVVVEVPLPSDDADRGEPLALIEAGLREAGFRSVRVASLSGTPDAAVRLVGDDESLAAIGLVEGSRGLAPKDEVGLAVVAAVGVNGLPPERHADLGDEQPVQLLVARSDHGQVDPTQIADRLSGRLYPLPVIAELNGSWVDGARVTVHQTRWVTTFGAGAMGALMLALWVGYANEGIRLVRQVVPLVIVAPRVRETVTVVAWRVGGPVLLAGLVGAGAGLLLSAPLQSFGLGVIDLPWQTAAWGVLGASVAGLTAWGVIVVAVLRDAYALRLGVSDE